MLGDIVISKEHVLDAGRGLRAFGETREFAFP